ncbi:hypothetical protein PV11_09716 [Exophiala sideris]|uniref:RING-type domain-containing protein n=1 Tax=Exophiala sideris TaxID=1016849 RepID=A0A0D1YAV7_9EURO|nr:hypothetical protein PV11_09716 [Exophiala sideris]
MSTERTATPEGAGAGTDIALLATFQKHIEDMRNLSLCKICIKPFYEPFILGCGHTYCYSCLASWFGGAQNRKKKKNCPDCRAEVTVQPSPNYLLRDLVHMFINRAELLPEDETVQEHQQAKEDEAVMLAADRTGAGLFKGAFVRTHTRLLPIWGQGILDQEDNVLRCPECHWELEDGECLQCGFHEYEPGDSDYDSGEDSGESQSIHTLDDDLDNDADDVDYAFRNSMYDRNTIYDESRSPELDGLESEPDPYGNDYGDDYDDDDDDMESFIDDGRSGAGDEDDDANSEATMTGYPQAIRVAPHHDSIRAARNHDHPPSVATEDYTTDYDDPDDDADADNGNAASNREATPYDDASDVNTNYDDTSQPSEDDRPFRPGRRVNRVISDDEDEEVEDEAQTEGTTPQDPQSGEEYSEVEDNVVSDDDEDQEDEADGEGGNADGSDDEQPSGSDESDIRPPHSAARRLQHLQSQRARRGNAGFQPHTHHSRGSTWHPYSDESRNQSRGRQHVNGYNGPPYGRRIPVGGGNRAY